MPVTLPQLAAEGATLRAVPAATASPPPPILTNAALRCIDRAGARVDADAIINAARADSQADDGTAYHLMAGSLGAAVRLLAAELNRLRGIGITSPGNRQTLDVSLGDATVILEYFYSPATDGKTWGPPEDCYEGEPEELDLHGVLVNGAWVDCTEDNFPADVLEQWSDAVRAEYERQCEAAQESRHG
jgi:hypothetical protein